MAPAERVDTEVADGAEAGVDGISPRRRLLSAAVSCILERGYYRASSNEIARRAGVSWGVIQYHYGSREELLLAVFEDACQQLLDHSRRGIIRGTTIREQLASYFDYLLEFYGRPEYMAYVEISQNLARDPSTSGKTLAALRQLRDEFARQGVVIPAITEPQRLLAFEAMQGMILSHQLRTNDALTRALDSQSNFERRAQALITALANYMENETAARPAE